MARRTIDPTVKTAVLVAALESGAKLPEIAKQYGVSLPTVYNWKNAALAEKAAAVASLVPATVPGV
jgi:transposase-like protein